MAKKTFRWWIFPALCFLSLAVFAEAAFLRNIPVKVRQPDGTFLACLASGDEFYNWLHDANGYTILRHPATGYLVYADKVDGKLVPTEFPALATQPAILEQAGVKKGLLDDREPLELDRRMALAADEPIVNVPRTGTINNLVVYIRFSDQDEFSQAYVDGVDTSFNSTVPGANSFRNYFSEASYNQLTIGTTFYPGSVPGALSYQDAYSRSYYMPYDATTNPEGYSGDTERRIREHTLLQSAVNAIAGEVPAGLTIDGDGDGFVDNICFIVKDGPTAWNTLLWPHKWALYSYSVYINTKRVYTYNLQLETTLDVGVLCHEMFHSLGAPDLYHYSSDGRHPVWAWDLMEYQTDPPQHMGAYMKWKYGTWIASIPQITASGTYSLSPLAGSVNNCYRIASPFSPTEFFVVEYRKREGTFEGSLYGQGLLVYRINPSYTGNANGPPDEVYIYRPNGTTVADGSPISAVFSSTAGRTAINDVTNPSSFLTAGGAGGLRISGIGAIDSTISFSVTLETITVTSPNGGESWNAGDSATVTWTNSGTIGSVDVLLSTDGGSNWMTLADDTANDGTQTITIPAIASTNCLIRVADSASGTIFDDSNAVFTIVSITDSLTVTAPNGGEAWVVGTSRSVTWTSTGNIENVSIDYSTDGGQNWLPAVPSTANSGTWDWTIPSTPSDTCLVRVADASNASVSDTSNTLFSIVGGASPMIKADFNQDGQEDILWRYQGVGDYQGWNVVWLMNDTQGLAPIGGSSIPQLSGAAKPSASMPGRSLKTPLEVGDPRNTAAPRSLRTAVGSGKPRLQRPRKVLKNALGPDRDPLSKAKGITRPSKFLIEPPVKDLTSVMNAGTTELAALGINDYYYLNFVQDLSWEIAGTGDFDGNGSTDILWRNYGTGDFSGWNVIWYMTGGSTTGFGYLYGISDLDWRIAGTGDFDQDGDIDILWRNYGMGEFSGWNVIWYMQGEGISGYGYLYGISDLDWQIAGAGDFDRDGDVDILWRNYGTGTYSGWNVIWYMQGEGISGYGYLNGISDLDWQIAGVGDFDNNGHLDIIWRNYGTGTFGGWNCIWYMEGEGIIGYDYPTQIPDLNWKIVNR